MSDSGGFVLLLIAFAIYFLPVLIALGRRHHQLGMVFVLNLFLGWTLVGWVVALAIAASAVKRPELQSGVGTVRSAHLPADTRPCPHCAELIKQAAKICRFCGREVAGAESRTT